jgi:hypothetical protein
MADQLTALKHRGKKAHHVGKRRPAREAQRTFSSQFGGESKTNQFDDWRTYEQE